MLKEISLKFTETNVPLVVPTKGVTIFVGSNNAGKSLVLRELETSLYANGTVATKIVSDFELSWPEESEFEKDIDSLKRLAPTSMVEHHIFVGRLNPIGAFEGQEVHREGLVHQFRTKNKYWVSSQFYRFFVVRLDGRTRFALSDDKSMGDLASRPDNVLAHLFQDDNARLETREVIHQAIGSYFVIDPTLGGTLRIRLSATPPTQDEQSLNSEARAFHRDATYIKEASDGVQAFVGLSVAVRSGDYRVVLIDEPEAFLHPPLARKLGYELASAASMRGQSLMASTHSPDFLMGCLQASSNVRVVRLEYSNGRSKGQIVDSEQLSQFFRTPLVRSANVISALFHDGVVVTESDNDRAFYSEVYFRLAEMDKNYPSILFVNAQNKQTIRDIIAPLRAFGVPAVAISDIDILKDGGATWSGWLAAAHVPDALHISLGQMRASVRDLFVKHGVDMKSGGGVSALPQPDRTAADHLFNTLDDYGIFAVRSGEVEHWLKDLGVPGKKTDWAVAMLDRLGADPNDQCYVRPSNDDVWEFMRRIVGWVKNPSRQGVN